MAIINFVRDYERVARFRLGKFQGMFGPGVIVAVPFWHQTVVLDLRPQTIEFPRQTMTTQDGKLVDVEFAIYIRVDINNADKAVLLVRDYKEAVAAQAGPAMEALIGEMTFAEVSSDRAGVTEEFWWRLMEVTDRWGVIVAEVVIKSIECSPGS